MNVELYLDEHGYIITNDGKKYSGVYQEFYPDGKILSEIEVKKGIKEGKFKKYSENGEILVEGTFRKNKEDGEWRRYDPERKDAIIIDEHNNGYLEKTNVYIHQEGTSQMILVAELYFMSNLLSSLTYNDEFSSIIMRKNSYCIKGILDKDFNIPEDLNRYEAGTLSFNISFIKDGEIHGPIISFDSFNENGPLKKVVLCENGRIIVDKEKNRKKILEYYYSHPRISAKGKKMIEKYFKKYPSPVSSAIKFLRGCFLFILFLILALVYLIYNL